MSKIKETVTAVSAGNEPGAVHISRKENQPMTGRSLEMVLECIVVVSLITAITTIVIFAEIWKVLALAAFGIFFSLIYFGLRN